MVDFCPYGQFRWPRVLITINRDRSYRAPAAQSAPFPVIRPTIASAIADSSAAQNSGLAAVCPPEFAFAQTPCDNLAPHRFATRFVFMRLQIPFPATPFFSHLYKTRGVLPDDHHFRRASTSRAAAKLCVLCGLPPLGFSSLSFVEFSRLFSIGCSLFPQNRGVGCPTSPSRRTYLTTRRMQRTICAQSTAASSGAQKSDET